MKLANLFFIILLSSLNGFSQKFINGDFENTTATADIINLSNTDLSSHLPNVTSFGSYGDVDIINSATYGGLAQSKQWYISLTGGGTDIVALELTSELIEGKKYAISFYDRCGKGYTASAFQIGLSKSNNSFGTVIFTSPDAPSQEKWEERRFTFVAPISGKYITVQMPEGSISTWAHIDNFSFTKTYCPEKITLTTSKHIINKGEEVRLTASGSNVFTWLNSNILTNSTGNATNLKPMVTETYTVLSKEDNCPTLTATVCVIVKESIKKDTVILPKKLTPDSIIKPKLTYKNFNRKKLNGRKLVVQEQLETTDNNIKIAIYDKNRLDGDVVSIYVNGQLFKQNIEVTKTKQEFVIPLQEGSNFIVMEAVNLGTVPPNTAGFSLIENGKKPKLITLISDMKKSGALEILYQPDGVSMR